VLADGIHRNEPLDAAALFDLLAGRRPAWQADAACREHPEVSWFSSRGGDQREAKAICKGCLVLDDCRSWALAQDPWLAGVWGGMTARERRLHRRSKAA
jgi:WhiB family redox-sensing transcriptional regulator